MNEAILLNLYTVKQKHFLLYVNNKLQYGLKVNFYFITLFLSKDNFTWVISVNVFHYFYFCVNLFKARGPINKCIVRNVASLEEKESLKTEAKTARQKICIK